MTIKYNPAPGEGGVEGRKADNFIVYLPKTKTGSLITSPDPNQIFGVKSSLIFIDGEWGKWHIGGMRAGEYSITALLTRDSNHGILDFYIDDTIFKAGVDLYKATQENNYTPSLGNITIPNEGVEIKWQINGKNPASSSYYCYLTAFILKEV